MKQKNKNKKLPKIMHVLKFFKLIMSQIIHALNN